MIAQMDRDIKHGNQLCFGKMLELSYKSFHQHLTNIHSTVQDRQTCFVRLSSAKRNYLRNLKQKEVLKENISLIERLKKVKIGKRYRKLAVIDNSKIGTLNSKYRKYEQQRIRMENGLLARRIVERSSLYSVKKWQCQRESVEKNLSLICRFGYKDFQPTRSQNRFYFQNKTHKSDKPERKPHSFTRTVQLGSNYYYVAIQGKPSQKHLIIKSIQGAKTTRVPIGPETGLEQAIQSLSPQMINELVNHS